MSRITASLFCWRAEDVPLACRTWWFPRLRLDEVTSQPPLQGGCWSATQIQGRVTIQSISQHMQHFPDPGWSMQECTIKTIASQRNTNPQPPHHQVERHLPPNWLRSKLPSPFHLALFVYDYWSNTLDTRLMLWVWDLMTAVPVWLLSCCESTFGFHQLM